MGLPLFVAPVESDIPSKSAAKSPANPAHSRSPIRRSDRRIRLNETRETRLRLLAALQGNDSTLDLPLIRHSDGESSPDPLASTNPPPPNGESNSNLSVDQLLTDSGVAATQPSPDYLEARRRRTARAPEESFIRDDGSNIPWNESTRSSNLWDWRRSGSPHEHSLHRTRRVPAGSRGSDDLIALVATRPSRPRGPDPGEYLNEYRRRRGLQPSASSSATTASNGAAGFARRAHRIGRFVRYVDGLGDRDRSLSPDGDGFWDTLQSTLTPDPQPPSVGSSFASTSASAAASQTANSSNTSITNPDDEAELPCDPADENSNSESEEAESYEVAQFPRRLRRMETDRRRSYADVAADTAPSAREDRPERLEWLTDMQRIVQGLASRQDIPDEWWAAAGLSRSMTWDESN